MFVTAAIISNEYKANVTAFVNENSVYSKVTDIVSYYYGILKAQVLVVIYNSDGIAVDTIEYLK